MVETRKERKIRISIFDDSEAILNSFPEYLALNLSHLPLDITPFHVTEKITEDNIGNFLTETKPDIVITDYRMPLAPLVVPTISKHIFPKTKVLLTSIHRIGIRAVNVAKGFKGQIVDADLDKDDIVGLKSKIQEFSFKPISIGLIGAGDFGIEMLNHLKLEEGISRLNVYSPRRKVEELYRLFERSKKIFPTNSLEEALEDTDLAIYCSTSLRGKEIVKLYLKDPTERKIFIQEYKHKKIQRNLTSIKESGYNGLVLMCSNKPEHYIEMGVRLGLNPAKLAFPIENDLRRMELAIETVLGNDELARGLIKRVAVLTTGTHRNPKLIFPKDFELPPEYSNTEEIQELLQKQIVKLAVEAQTAAHQLRTSYKVPQEAISRFCLDFAHYTPGPVSASMYTFLDSEKGVIALPRSVDYNPGISLTLDREILNSNGIEIDRINKIVRKEIISQKAILDEFLTF